MTRLLVSVRDVAEAGAALAGGADVIDIKEPSQGPLGAADARMWSLIRDAVAGSVPVSAALGELASEPVEQRVAQAHGLTWVKVGLAHCGSDTQWTTRWQRVGQALPAGVALVAAAYADWHAADAPPPSEVLAAAVAQQCPVLLLDTWNKSAGCLFDCLPLADVQTLCRAAQQHHLQVALAGSLRSEHLDLVRACAPDLLAVRGAVCRGARDSAIDEQLVCRLSSELKQMDRARSQRAG